MSAIALDPLIAEAKERARRRRLYLVIVLVVAVATGGAFFWRFTLGSESSWPLPAEGGSSALASARFAGYGLSFRYPANWKRLDCTQVGSFESNLTYLTNAPSAGCYPDLPNESSGRPPAIRLGEAGILVQWWDYGYRSPVPRFAGRAAMIGGMAARVGTIMRSPGQPWLTSMCGDVGAEASQVVAIHRPPPGDADSLIVTACFRGPDVSANAAAFRQMLASVRIAKG